MWRWLPNVLCSKTTGCLSQRKIFFLQLIFLVFCLHLLIFGLYALGIFLFSKKEKFDISLTNKAVTYVLLPLQRNVGAKKVMTSISKKSHEKSQVITMQKYADKKSKQGAKKTVAAKSVAAKSAKKTISAPEEIVSIKIQDTVKNHKNNKPKPKAVVYEDVDVTIEQITEEQKIEPKDALLQVEQNNKSAFELESNSNNQSNINMVETNESFDENEVIFVGAQELQHHMIGSKIQQTIQQHWNVPIGMEQGTSCEVQVKVGDVGQAAALQIIKSSGVLVYDTCARKTLQKIEYPKQVWNKTITIVLGAT